MGFILAPNFPFPQFYNMTFQEYPPTMRMMYMGVISIINLTLDTKKNPFQAYQFFGKMTMFPLMIAYLMLILACLCIGSMF